MGAIYCVDLQSIAFSVFSVFAHVILPKREKWPLILPLSDPCNLGCIFLVLLGNTTFTK